MKDETLRYFVAASLIKNLSHLRTKSLIAAAGGVQNIFENTTSLLSKINLPPSIIAQLSGDSLMNQAEDELEKAEKAGIDVIGMFDVRYPYRLKQCADAPLILYRKGDMDLNKGHFVAVVGTRMATHYGKARCAEFIKDLSNQDVSIISGLALGIDSYAHQEALDNGLQTGAVLAHHLNRIYPSQNTKLAHDILQTGCLLSDFPISSSPSKGNFPSRNRIIAGMADATIVIESAKKGGSLITADIANSYNREVMAFPGRTDDAFSVGCNQLIKNQKAALIEHADDLIRLMNWDEAPKRSIQQSLFIDLTPEEEKIVSYLREFQDSRIDEISRKSGISISKTATILLHLEFKNVVESLPGKMYKLRG